MLRFPTAQRGPRTTDVAASPRHDDPLAHQCHEWYEAYGELVYRYIRFHVHSADLADDLTADTFLKAIRSLDQFMPAKGSARIWLLRIAANTLRDHFRRTRLRQHVPLSQWRDLAADAPSPEERLLWEEQVGRLLAAVSRLNQHDRDLVSLRYGSGLDNAAIAHMHGISEVAVRQRLSRALRRLRQTLENMA